MDSEGENSLLGRGKGLCWGEASSGQWRETCGVGVPEPGQGVRDGGPRARSVCAGWGSLSLVSVCGVGVPQPGQGVWGSLSPVSVCGVRVPEPGQGVRGGGPIFRSVCEGSGSLSPVRV